MVVKNTLAVPFAQQQQQQPWLYKFESNKYYRGVLKCCAHLETTAYFIPCLLKTLPLLHTIVA